MIELNIDSLQVSPVGSQHVAILKEKATERYLPIWIDPAETSAVSAIVVRLQEIGLPRPLTHDLLHSVIEALGATVECIVITDLQNDIFYAKIILNLTDGRVEINCRPSDGLALAVTAEVPIFADDKVVDKAGISLDKETSKAIARETPDDTNINGDELRKMSAFTDFINTLDLDNFGKRGKR